MFFNSSYPRLHHSSIRSVVTDDYDGGRTLVQYLAEKGIKRIGGLFKSDDIQGTLRFSGFIDAVMKAGLPFSDKNVGWFTTETRDRIPEVCSGTIRSILSECEAVICYNDEVADILAGIMASVPPEETSIRYIGSFDNVSSLHGLSGISTVSLGYPRDRMGRLITEKLINMLDGHHEESLVLPWTNE